MLRCALSRPKRCLRSRWPQNRLSALKEARGHSGFATGRKPDHTTAIGRKILTGNRLAEQIDGLQNLYSPVRVRSAPPTLFLGIAIVFNNLGLVYQAQGDPATPRKCTVRHWPVFGSWKTGTPRRRLSGTSPTNEWSRGICVTSSNFTRSHGKGREDTGRIANTGYNIAIVHQLQEDLPGAEQGFERSLAIWQKNGD